MIQCPNCTAENGDLSLVCVKCGGFLQARIPTLDLFNTIWQVIELPKRAMRRIVLAVHKNYAILLSAFYGIGLAFSFMWLFNFGERFENLLYLIFAGLLFGPALGVIHILIIATVGIVVSRFFSIRMHFADLLGVAAYATVPVILSVVFLLPIELMTFGLFMFAENPSPFVIKPFPYIIFMILDGLTVLWSIGLFVIGIRTIGNLKVLRAMLIVILTLSVSLFILFELLKWIA